MPAPDIKFDITTERNRHLNTEGCEALAFCVFGEFDTILTKFPAPIAQVIQQTISKQHALNATSHEMVISSMGLYPVPKLIVLYNKESVLSLQRIRELGAHTARLAGECYLQQIAIDLTTCLPAATSFSVEVCVAAWTEGIGLGSYTIKSYKQSEASTANTLQSVEFLINDDHATLRLQQAIEHAIAFSDATNYTRDLTNLPSNKLTPATLADEAVRLAELGGMKCHVLDETEIMSLGMGGLAAVGQGSVHAPRMIVLNYQGSTQSDTVYGLIGKGITFDTGGISLKKADGMEEMISDMGGAAVVLGVMQALSRLKPDVNVVAVIPAAENMPSGSAYKPGDIITTMSGRTVEVLNTDAEGRIVLADAVTYARQLGATKLIDVATLTGAVLVALGDVATAAIANNDAFLDQLLKAAEYGGEKLWQLPVYPEFKEMLRSTVADLRNSTGNRLAGAITAGLFIGAFADDIPWIHLDTGGTAWLWKARGMEPQGATGAMVRTLLHHLTDPHVTL